MIKGKLKRRRNLLISLGLVLVLVAAACGGDEDETPGPGPAATSTTPAGEATPTTPAGEPTPTTPAGEPTPTTPAGEPTPTSVPVVGDVPIPGGFVRLDAYGDPPSFDPTRNRSWLTMNFASFTQSRLFGYTHGPNWADPNSLEFIGNLEPAPDLALGFEWESDTALVLFLRDGVRWHNKPPLNGRQFVCSDVQFTLERYLEPESPNRELFGTLESVECRDDLTAVLHLSAPFAPLVQVLALGAVHMFAPEVLEEFGDLNTPEAVIGTGPWILNVEESEPLVQWVWDKNPDYYRAAEGIPYIERVIWRVIPDAVAQFADFQAQKTEFAGNLFGGFLWWTGIPLQDLYDMADEGRAIVVVKGEVVWGDHLALRTDKPPFNDVRVRRAISMAIDREAEAVAAGSIGPNGEVYKGREIGEGTTQWFLPFEELDPECQENYEYNPTRARELLTEAGYPDGFSATFTTTADYGLGFSGKTEFLASALEAIGIDLTIQNAEYGTYITAVARGEFDDIAHLAQSFFTDPDAIAGFFLPGTPRNASHVDDPFLTDLLLQQRVEIDPVARKALWDEIQRYMACQVYYVVPSSIPVDYGWQPYLLNYGPKADWNAMAKMLEEAWLAEDAPTR
ncbi:MAG: ABC transporter substrate-binding protein [Dehalococcoidia bacterium]